MNITISKKIIYIDTCLILLQNKRKTKRASAKHELCLKMGLTGQYQGAAYNRKKKLISHCKRNFSKPIDDFLLFISMLMHSKKSNEILHEQAMLESIEAIKKFIGTVAPMEVKDMELLPQLLEYKQVKKNDYILREGEICRNVYFLTKGFLRMFFVDHSGNEVNYRFTFDKNFFVDFQSFLLQKPSHFFWQAMQDSEFLVLPKAAIQRLYAASPAWNNFGRLISEKVYLQMNERVEMLLFMSPEERYNHLLSAQPELFAMVSQFHLSSYLGIKPESLSRLRKRLLKK